MPHSREVRPTSHDAHDPILVAALAAGDLAGTDRDQALDLTRSCADCSLLHDDLLALARATASVPPPITVRPRDFRLTPADAARLRPNGWRRLAAAVSGARTGLSRPLGVGLATLGLAGLLIGNVQIGFGGSASSPEAARVGMESGTAAASAGDTTVLTDAASQSSGRYSDVQGGAPAGVGAVPAASAARPLLTGGSAAGSVTPSGEMSGAGGAFVPGPSGPREAVEQVSDDSTALYGVTSDAPFRPMNLLFGTAIVLGLGLLLVSLRRGHTID